MSTSGRQLDRGEHFEPKLAFRIRQFDTDPRGSSLDIENVPNGDYPSRERIVRVSFVNQPITALRKRNLTRSQRVGLLMTSAR